jgi:hypothetical protein
MPSESTRATATEFVEEAFETTVDKESRERLVEAIDAAVSALREQIDDDTLERILRAGSGSYLLRASMTRDGLQPESFTQQAVVEPLLDALGYDYATEAGGLSGGQTLVADYTVSLRAYDGIDSTRLLIEAEPANKELDSREHGAGQVRDWLGQREFESDFGFATDGLRWSSSATIPIRTPTPSLRKSISRRSSSRCSRIRSAGRTRPKRSSPNVTASGSRACFGPSRSRTSSRSQRTPARSSSANRQRSPTTSTTTTPGTSSASSARTNGPVGR